MHYRRSYISASLANGPTSFNLSTATSTKEMPPKKGTSKAKAKGKAAGSKRSAREVVETNDVELPEPPKKKTRTESPPATVQSEPSKITQKQNATSASSSAIEASTTPKTTMPANGGFCLYSMDLPFLKKALIPDDKTKKKDYAALFAKIKEFQAKKDRTAQIHVAFPSETSNGYGRFKSRSQGFVEPMGDMPYEIGIASLTKVENLSLACPVGLAGDVKDKKGVSGGTMLTEPDCGVTAAQGEFKLRTTPVWKKDGPGGGEIYEGYVSFVVKYGMYARKGHGSGTNQKYSFWAIRSREGDTLDGGDVAHLAHEMLAGSAIGLDDLVGGFDEEFDDEFDDEFGDSDDDDYGYGYGRRGRYGHGYGGHGCGF